MPSRMWSMVTIAVLAIAAVVPVFNAPSAHATNPFRDVSSSSQFVDDIAWIADHRISHGYADGNFRPKEDVSRAAMAAFIYRLAGMPAFSPPSRASFSDVPRSHQFFREIEWMASEGIATGYADGRFRPLSPVSREATAAFMFRLVGSPSHPGPSPQTFADVQPQGSGLPYANQFSTPIAWMAGFEISNGYYVPGAGVRVFRPKVNVSREAMAAFMKRMAPMLNPIWGTDYVAECSDGIDNDGDGLIDYPHDPDCWGPLDNNESPSPGVGNSTFGNPGGGASIPTVARQVDTSNPDQVVGNGTPGSCTSNALAQAVRGGGIVTFNCGPAPHTIPLNQTLYTCNTHNCDHPWRGGIPVELMVLDGGGLITLDGRDQRGIFYANTCQESFGWLSASCQNETIPKFVFQNITFINGNATTLASQHDGVGGGGGGGAIAVRGGQLIVNNASFSNNRCVTSHSDAGGGGIRVTQMAAPTYIVNTTIANNRCANGGGISALHVTVHVLNSVIDGNRATGQGASSGQGGNGGGMYGDGNNFQFRIVGSIISGNVAPEGGPGVFFVSNNRTGTLTIDGSFIIDNTGQRFFTSPYRNIFYLGSGPIRVTGGSTVH